MAVRVCVPFLLLLYNNKKENLKFQSLVINQLKKALYRKLLSKT
jgi:hypothetical protein